MISTTAFGTIAARPASREAPFSDYDDPRLPATPLERLLAFGNGPLRNFFFLLAVLALNYTISRPSPVDFFFLCVVALCVAPNQRLTSNSVVLFGLLTAWISSVFVSSISLVDKPDVTFTMLALTHVILIAIGTCLLAVQWGERKIHRFIDYYILATSIASVLGIIGFVTRSDVLTWDARARGFTDDPNMYSAMLIPAIFGCLYMLTQGRRLLLYGAALALLLIGIVVGFSRAAVGALALWGTIWLIFLNRNNLAKAAMYAAVLPIVVVVAAGLAYFLMGDFGAKLAQRFTLAMEYDRGQGGRYSRYFRSLEFILDHPLGMGMFEIDRYFPEPIHNIWLSSFLNYGWLAGIAWTLLVVLAFRVTYVNYRRTGSPLPVLFLVSWMAILSCALLHQAERWRHFWMFAGLLWGFNWRNFAPGGGRDDTRSRA